MIATDRLQPDCLMDKHGQPIFGQFNSPIIDLGLSKFNYLNCMDKPASKLKRHFDYKQFQFININCQDYLLAVAIADIRYLGNAFVYIFDKKTNQVVEQHWLKPLHFGFKTTPSVIHGTSVFTTPANSIKFKIIEGVWHLTLKTKHINANLELSPLANSLPMSMCTPTGYNGWTYTQKHNALLLSGELNINNQPQDLSRALAGYDFSAGYMRRETNWCWASISAFIEGHHIGLNLASGVNETSGSENVFWLDGIRHYLPQVTFEFNRHSSADETHSPWKVYSTSKDTGNALVDLSFQPLNCRKEKINALLIKSNFRQYMGYYQGIIRDNQGNEIVLDNVFGLSEDHYAKW